MAKPDRKKEISRSPKASGKTQAKAKAPAVKAPATKKPSKPAQKPAPKPLPKAVAKAAPSSKPKLTQPPVTVPKKISKPDPKIAAAKAPAPAKAIKPAKPSKAAPVSHAENNHNHHEVEKVKAPSKPAYTGDFLEKQKQRLIELRDHLVDQMQGVAQDTLRVRAEGSEASAFGMHQADAGSDAYDKDFALSLLSQEQDALYEIEEALKRIEGGTYGTCEMSNKAIPKVRLEAIPHARFTVECQAQLERENKGRRRWDTVPQFMDSAEALVDEEEESSEEDDRRKEKE